MKKIQMKITSNDIDNVINEIQLMKKDVKGKVHNLIEELVDKGVEIAKAEVRRLGAYYTGELESNIVGYFSPTLGAGIIKANAPYAIFVEFGTGVVGEGNPHPDKGDWEYDINNHGDDGWLYFNERDNKWHWTKGMESRPFLYNTVLELQKLAKDEAKVVFKR